MRTRSIEEVFVLKAEHEKIAKSGTTSRQRSKSDDINAQRHKWERFEALGGSGRAAALQENPECQKHKKKRRLKKRRKALATSLGLLSHVCEVQEQKQEK